MVHCSSWNRKGTKINPWMGSCIPRRYSNHSYKFPKSRLLLAHDEQRICDTSTKSVRYVRGSQQKLNGRQVDPNSEHLDVSSQHMENYSNCRSDRLFIQTNWVHSLASITEFQVIKFLTSSPNMTFQESSSKRKIINYVEKS